MSIVYTAPIGILISGKDSALYGKPVLIAASKLRVRIELSEEKSTNNLLIEFVKKKVYGYLKIRAVSLNGKPQSHKISSDINESSDQGYQAAVIVSGVAAYLEFHTGKESDMNLVNMLAYQIEKEYFHQSNGYYTSASTFGGLIFFRREFEFLKSISRLNFKIPKDIIDSLLLIRNRQSTKLRSSELSKIYNLEAKRVEELFNKQERLTKRLVVAIAKEDKDMFLDSLKATKGTEALLYSLVNKNLNKQYTERFELFPKENKDVNFSEKEHYEFKISEEGLLRI